MKIFLLLASVLSKKYIIQVEENVLFFQDNYFNNFNNILFGDNSETITVGEANFIIIDNNVELPLELYGIPGIVSIEEDAFVSISPINISEEEYFNKKYSVQASPPWNLDRIDQRGKKLDEKYYYYDSAGKNVDVYVVDTGIDITHPEFQGRARFGGNFIDDNDADCNGHGTHVAGTVGSKTFGVAKNTNLVAVKVLDCTGSGSFSGILKGLSYVSIESKKTKRPTVVNMSLGGSFSPSINKAVENLKNEGIHIASAAGNENQDACNTSPGSSEASITVAAIDNMDTKASFSNYGKCVDILLPGVNIQSVLPGFKIGFKSGTSMASPALAGIMALILSENQSFSPDTLKKILKSFCTKNAVKGFDANTPNCLAYTLI
jgi:subtilisin family serine protease